jgi:hypothetical protein
MRRKVHIGINAILILAAAAAAAAGVPSESGAPFAVEVAAPEQLLPGIVNDVADDAAYRPPDGALAGTWGPVDSTEVEAEEATGRRASEFLELLPEGRRLHASIQLELPRGPAAESAGAIREVELLWAAGRFDEAIDAVRALEDDGLGVDVAVSYDEPIPVDGPTIGNNVRITADVAGEAATDTAIDVDRHNGNLFAMARAAGSYAIYRSINGGGSWAETATWCCDPGQVDLAIAANWGYVVYDSPTENEVRMRRVFGTTGAFDSTYFWKPVVPHATQTVSALIMESNADVFDNRIYTALRLSDSSLAWWWSDATTAETFNRIDPGVTDAAGGLSMSYVHGWDGTGPYLYLSYRNTAGAVWVRPRNASAWTAGTMVATGVWSGSTTSVSAWDDTVLVGYCQWVTDGYGAYYRISYDEGSGWNVGTLVAPAEGGDFYDPLLSARSGTGTAALIQQEAGTFDRLDFKQRFNYAPGGWTSLQQLNDVDFVTVATSIDFEYLHTGWGVTYVSPTGEVWFTLSRALFYSGFERSNLGDWVSVTP